MSYDVGEVTESLELCSLSKISVTSPTSQLILQPFFRLSYVTEFSLTSPGETPMGQTDKQTPKLRAIRVVIVLYETDRKRKMVQKT